MVPISHRCHKIYIKNSHKQIKLKTDALRFHLHYRRQHHHFLMLKKQTNTQDNYMNIDEIHKHSNSAQHLHKSHVIFCTVTKLIPRAWYINHLYIWYNALSFIYFLLFVCFCIELHARKFSF